MSLKEHPIAIDPVAIGLKPEILNKIFYGLIIKILFLHYQKIPN